MPTLMGYDADHPISDGEVGHCGVNISSLKDMEVLFEGIDLSKVSVSMTINGPAIIIFGFYIALAIKNNIDLEKLENFLKEISLLKNHCATIKLHIKCKTFMKNEPVARGLTRRIPPKLITLRCPAPPSSAASAAIPRIQVVTITVFDSFTNQSTILKVDRCIGEGNISGVFSDFLNIS